MNGVPDHDVAVVLIFDVLQFLFLFFSQSVLFSQSVEPELVLNNTHTLILTRPF